MRTKLVMVLAAIGCVGTAQAAEEIRYEEIPAKLAPFGSVIAYRGITVTTKNGKKYYGRRLRLEADHVRVFPMDPNAWKDIPAEDITRIKISQAWRYIHHFGDNASLGMVPFGVCGGGPACALALIIEPPFLVYAAATAPVYLAADVVALFRPASVYEIVH